MSYLLPRKTASAIPLSSVQGIIHIDAVAPSSVVGAGSLTGGCPGVRFDLYFLRDAVDAAIARLYPGETPEDLGHCPVDLQVVRSEYQGNAPLLVITSPKGGLRQCVTLAGIVVDGADPRTVQDAIAARGVTE